MQTPFDEATTDAAQALEPLLSKMNNCQKLETISIIAFSLLASVSLDHALVEVGGYDIPDDAIDAIDFCTGDSEEKKLQLIKALASRLTLPEIKKA